MIIKITHAQNTVNIVTLYFARASSKYMIPDFELVFFEYL